MDEVTKQHFDKIAQEKRVRQQTLEDINDVIKSSNEEKSILLLNAIKTTADAVEQIVDKVEKLASKEIIVNPPAVNVTQKEVKVDTVKVSNLKELQLPTPEVKVTTEKYEIVNENVDLEPLEKAIKETRIPVGEGVEASKKADPTRYTVMRLSNGRQFIEPVGGGSAGGGGAGDRTWPIINITYDGSNNPTSIVKQADGVRMTQNIEYDGSNNPVRFTVKYDNI